MLHHDDVGMKVGDTITVQVSDTAGMDCFGELTRQWFQSSFAAPTAAQVQAWSAIASGSDTLVVAPTGSGKTLAAFLLAVDRLARTEDRPRATSVLYISPLKALGVDVERNLRSPLVGIAAQAKATNQAWAEITVGVRSGDTDAAGRRRLLKSPPDILITTPESLFLMLTSQAAATLTQVHTVIVDEIHALAGTKRGAHLALSLERLEHAAASRPQRIGLSATVRPAEVVAEFLSGAHPTTIVQPPAAKALDLAIDVPVPDLGDLPRGDVEGAESVPPSIWPHIEERLVDLISEHRSTLIFANSRRQAERLTARLNEQWATRAGLELPGEHEVATAMPGLAGQSLGAPTLVRAHHGSVSKEQRAQIEDLLKSGELPAVVATSSLELGIDMGAIDLVCQIEAPPSVAAGLQRVGRAGHQVGAASKGVVFPKHRGDLLISAVVAQKMLSGQIESLRIPRNPLDVLAQQIVSMVATAQWQAAEMLDLVRRSAPFRTLPDSAFTAVLDMLAGRYPAEEFATLKPRLNWDRGTDTLTGRPGSARVAVTSGGTIPDRGLYGVYLVGGPTAATRVGELDEEMVYESRVGDVFALGATSWRIEDITADRVLVSPAPGRAGKLPFWHGDLIGRPYELGREIGAFVRTVGGAAHPSESLAPAPMTAWAKDNLIAYLKQQRDATGVLPDDRTIVVERFRDEVGDWRVIWHSPFGARVHTPWALAIAATLRDQHGIDAQVMATDDGIIAHLPDTGDEDLAATLASAAFLEPDRVHSLVLAELGGSALFAARFRECASRALLLPRRDPQRRTPLWQQRQRSAQLLAVAAKYPSFPITLETMRECVQDVYDVPHLVELLSDIAGGRLRVVEVTTSRPSPFAQSLLFSYLATFMYEGDSPLAERRAQALALDPDLMAQLLGEAQLRDLLAAEAIAEIEDRLQLLVPDRQPRTLDQAADALRLLGPFTRQAALDRGITSDVQEALVAARRAIWTRVAGRDVLAAVEDAGRLRDALGAPLPAGIATAFLEPVTDPLGDLVARYARNHGPFSTAEVAEAYGLGVAVVEQQLRQLAAAHRVTAGEFRPGTQGSEWCDTDVLRKIRRASAALLQQAVEPVEPVALAQFLPHWHDLAAVGRRPSRSGVDGVFAAIEQLAGVPIPASAWESTVLPSRVADYQSAWLDELTAAGEVVWWGTAALPGGDGWVCLAPTDLAPGLRTTVAAQLTELAESVLAALAGGGAWFLPDIIGRVLPEHPSVTAPAVVEALWELVWAGLITNDSLSPLRAGLTGSSNRRTSSAPISRRRRVGTSSLPTRGAGRWSALPAPAESTTAAITQVEQLLTRHGLVVRGSLAIEPYPGGFAAAYRTLTAFAERGRVTKIYLVAGLGGAQFGPPSVIDRIRADRSPQTFALAATDPANPYGASLPWPDTAAHRAGRKAGALLVMTAGEPVLYLERGGHTLLTFPGTNPAALPEAAAALAEVVGAGRIGRVTITRINATPVTDLPKDHEVRAALTQAGFGLTPRGLRLAKP